MVTNKVTKTCTLLHLSAPLQNLLNGDFFGISTSKSASYENRLAFVVNTNLLIYRYVCDPLGVRTQDPHIKSEMLYRLS